MYLLYLDASGTPALSDASKHYVLLGVCIHERKWHGFNKRLQDLKREYSLGVEQIELHAKAEAGRGGNGAVHHGAEAHQR